MKVKAGKWIDPKTLLCKGRIKPTKKGPSFCYKVKRGKDPKKLLHAATFQVEFHSRRTGKPLGFLGFGCTFAETQDKAQTWDYLNESAAEFSIHQCLLDAQRGGKARWEKEAKATVKTLKKIAEL